MQHYDYENPYNDFKESKENPFTNPYGYSGLGPQPIPPGGFGKLYNSLLSGQPNGYNPLIRKNLLNDDEYDKLDTLQSNSFDLRISEIAHLKSICTHRSKDGLTDMLIPDPEDPDNKVICKLCRKGFKPIQPPTNSEEIDNKVQDVIDILQTIKILFPDFPAKDRDFFDIIAILEKVPKLYYIAEKSMKKYTPNTPNDLFNMMSNDLPDEIEPTSKRGRGKKKTE